MQLVKMSGMVLAVWLAGCSKTADENDIPKGEATGMIQIQVGASTPSGGVDPGVESVFVRIDQVEVQHEDEGWVDISEARMDLDLMAQDAIIADGDVWVGAYDKLQIGIVDAWVVVDGVEHELKFMGDVDPLDPLATNLTVNEAFFVDEDSDTTVNVGWDLGDNLQVDDGVWSLGAQTTADVDIVATGDM